MCQKIEGSGAGELETVYPLPLVHVKYKSSHELIWSLSGQLESPF